MNATVIFVAKNCEADDFIPTSESVSDINNKEFLKNYSNNRILSCLIATELIGEGSDAHSTACRRSYRIDDKSQ